MGIINETVVINGWKFIPRHRDDAYVPAEIERHINLLQENGFVILQEIIGHEPEAESKQPPDYGELVEMGREMGRVVAAMARALAIGLAVVTYALALALVNDPILIVVLEDGTWLCVGEWLE